MHFTRGSENYCARAAELRSSKWESWAQGPGLQSSGQTVLVLTLEDALALALRQRCKMGHTGAFI